MTGETHSTHVPSATCRTDEAPQNVLTIELPDRALYTLSKISIAKWCIQPRLKEEVARVENKPWHTIAGDRVADSAACPSNGRIISCSMSMAFMSYTSGCPATAARSSAGPAPRTTCPPLNSETRRAAACAADFFRSSCFAATLPELSCSSTCSGQRARTQSRRETAALRRPGAAPGRSSAVPPPRRRRPIVSAAATPRARAAAGSSPSHRIQPAAVPPPAAPAAATTPPAARASSGSPSPAPPPPGAR